MSQCYDWHSDTQSIGKLRTSVWFQCPSGNTCCIEGGECLDYNLCHTPGSTSSTSGSYSSYYVARCSDPTYTSPDCQKVCNAPGPPDAVYNYTSQQWNCCGDDSSGNVACSNPTSEVFQAPAPADLKELSSDVAIVSTETLVPGDKTSTSAAISAAASSTASSSSSSPTTSSISSAKTSMSSSSSGVNTSTTESTASSQPQQTNSSLSTTSSPTGLSTGAKAGIAICVVLAIAALVALILFFLRRRRNQSTAPAPAMTPRNQDVDGYGQQLIDVKHVGVGVVPMVAEKSANGDETRSELSSNNEWVSGKSGGKIYEIGSSR